MLSIAIAAKKYLTNPVTRVKDDSSFDLKILSVGKVLKMPSDGVVNNLLQCVTIVCINYSIKVDSVHTIKLYKDY